MMTRSSSRAISGKFIKDVLEDPCIAQCIVKHLGQLHEDPSAIFALLKAFVGVTGDARFREAIEQQSLSRGIVSGLTSGQTTRVPLQTNCDTSQSCIAYDKLQMQLTCSNSTEILTRWCQLNTNGCVISWKVTTSRVMNENQQKTKNKKNKLPFFLVSFVK